MIRAKVQSWAGVLSFSAIGALPFVGRDPSQTYRAPMLIMAWRWRHSFPEVTDPRRCLAVHGLAEDDSHWPPVLDSPTWDCGAFRRHYDFQSSHGYGQNFPSVIATLTNYCHASYIKGRTRTFLIDHCLRDCHSRTNQLITHC